MGYLIQLNVYVVLNGAKKCRPYLFTKAFGNTIVEKETITSRFLFPKEYQINM